MPASEATVLIIDDDPAIREILGDRLEARGYRVLTAADGQTGLTTLDQAGPHLVLLDIELPDMNGLEVLKEIRRREVEVTVVMITAHGTIERAVQAMKDGAYDFLTKPFEPDRVALTVQRALEREGLKREKALLAEAAGEPYRHVIGQSSAMQEALAVAQPAARSKATVLLLGESGTGKEVFARAIHDWSERRDKPFVAINCVAIPKELMESELFGHERGAFTGAEKKKGKLERAHGGTVFLDEIGDLALELQAKLLRFLQEEEIERVGGAAPIPLDVRVIAATNRDLETAVKAGHFRNDLYYRLDVVSLTLPPLRERAEDIPSLAHFFLRRFADETKKRFTEITPEAQARLCAYEWPGNIRELANVMERAVVLGHGPRVTLRDLPPRLVGSTPQVQAASTTLSYKEGMDAYRRDLILQALGQAQGNHTAAAKLLGLQRTHLQRLLKDLQIDD